MKTTVHYLALLVLLFSIPFACTSNDSSKSVSKSTENAAAGIEADTSISGLINMINKVQEAPPISGDKKLEYQLTKVKGILTQIKQLGDSTRMRSSGPITYSDFVARRGTFVQKFTTLIDLGVFPTYFDITRNAVDSLYHQGQKERHKTAVRMYPVWDSRLLATTKHSWAFAWVDTTDHGSEQFRNTVIMDIINPCPPPYDCH